MNIFEFENKMRSELSQGTAAVDLDNLIADLGIHKSNQRPVYWIWGLLAMGLITTFSLSYMYVNSLGQEQDDHVKEILISQSNKPTPEQTTTVLIDKSVDEEEVLDEEEVINIKSDIPVKEKTEESFENTKQIKSEVPVNRTKTETRNQAISSVKNNTKKQSSLHVLKDNVKHIFNENKVNETNILNDDNASQVVEREDVRTAVSNDLGDSKNVGIVDIASIEDLKWNLLNTNVRSLDGLGFTKCPSFKSNRWRFSLVPEVGYLFPMKSLRSKSTEYQEITEFRNQEEKSLEGLQVALYGMYRKDQGIYFKGGISYTRYTEQLNLDRTYSEFDTTRGLISVTVSPDSDTLTMIYGDIVEETVITEKKKIHHKFHMVDIPVAVGYNLDFESFSLDIEAGVKFNIYTKATGRLYDGNGAFVDLKDTNMFRNSVGLGFFGGVHFRKQIFNDSWLYVGPRMHIMPNAFSNADNPVQQKYNAFGIHVGYIHKFPHIKVQ